MIVELFFLFWFILPAGIANMMPVFAAQLPVLRDWSYPLDGYATRKGNRILGNHKTVRGLVTGTIIAVLFCALQFATADYFPGFRHLFPDYYHQLNPWLLGFLLGFGALAGDAVKSGFKRGLNIAAGKTWFPFDQVDFIIGALIATSFYVQLAWWEYALLIIVGPFFHIAVNYIGYLLKIRDQII